MVSFDACARTRAQTGKHVAAIENAVIVGFVIRSSRPAGTE